MYSSDFRRRLRQRHRRRRFGATALPPPRRRRRARVLDRRHRTGRPSRRLRPGRRAGGSLKTYSLTARGRRSVHPLLDRCDRRSNLSNPPSESDGLLNFRSEIFVDRLFPPQTGQTVVRVRGHQGSDSVSISHPPLKPLPESIPLKIQSPISNSRDRAPCS